MDLTRRPGATGTIVIPKPAAALHNRAAPARTIDLRDKASSASIVRNPNRTPAAAPKTAVAERRIARFSDRFDRARKLSRSAQISHYGTDRFGNIQDPSKMYDKFGRPTLETLRSSNGAASATSAPAPAPERHAPAIAAAQAPAMPRLAATQHEAMAKLAPAAAPAPTIRPNMFSGMGLSSHRIAAAMAAITIMAGYVWVQNYPKMALQNASNHAGLAASLPGYLPSSYSLAHTNTSPGLVTLKFSSPSAPEALTIAQHRTTWDSSSLLDNFVAKKADDYATFQGQGLTIYLFGQNQATWVNHGVWYSIEGATRLSREQILKIAYSL
jgi:hypothetical protein